MPKQWPRPTRHGLPHGENSISPLRHGAPFLPKEERCSLPPVALVASIDSVVPLLHASKGGIPSGAIMRQWRVHSLVLLAISILAGPAAAAEPDLGPRNSPERWTYLGKLPDSDGVSVQIYVSALKPFIIRSGYVSDFAWMIYDHPKDLNGTSYSNVESHFTLYCKGRSIAFDSTSFYGQDGHVALVVPDPSKPSPPQDFEPIPPNTYSEALYKQLC